MRLADLARLLEAELCGPADGEVTGVAGLEAASHTDLTFVANPRYASLAHTTAAGAVLVDPAFPAITRPTLRIANPYLAFARAAALFYQAPQYPPGVHATAVIDPTADLGPGAHVGPYVVIGPHCRVGADAVLLAHCVLYEQVVAGDRLFVHAHAVVREGCTMGHDVTLGNGVILGGDGFGFAREALAQGGSRWVKIPQAGPVHVGDGVEIQSNATIDRASVGETRIASGAKIDNLVQVGHGSRIGENTLLCAQVGLAGSTTIGRNVILAGQVGVAGHLTVGDGAVATAQTGIPSDVAPGATVSGYPAMDNRAWLRSVAAFHRLPELLRKMRRTS